MNELQWKRCKVAAWTVLSLVVILWIIEIIDVVLLGNSLNLWGIYPRSLDGLTGIVFWPFLHGNLDHLVNNTFPLLIMGWFVALNSQKQFLKISAFISLLSGLMVWLFAVSADIHLGASGLVFGFFGFLIMKGILEKDNSSILVAVAVVFFYGSSIFVGLLPIYPGISWEGHLAGLISGIIAAKVFKNPISKINA